MRSIIVTQKNSNKRVDKVLKESFLNMPTNAMYKAFRKKDIKVNGLKVKENHIVFTGDKIDVFITDDILDGIFPTPSKDKFSDSPLKPKDFSIVYEDHNILIVNKPQGIPVHPDRDQTDGTLIDRVREYLNSDLSSSTSLCNIHDKKIENDMKMSDNFSPALCHRLDRNTGGVVIIAKNEEALNILLKKFKNGEIKKYYICIVLGILKNKTGELTAYLKKDEHKSKVFISDKKSKDYQTIITNYKVIDEKTDTEQNLDISILQINPLTGRTHQIRAHLAHIGHPVIGDGKYGQNSVNRAFGAKFQALWAYKITFDFKEHDLLYYLKEKSFTAHPEFKPFYLNTLFAINDIID